MFDANPQIFFKDYRNPVKQTKWYVITVGLGSGNTTTVDLLSARGYKITIEHARH